jgi:elongation factor G
MRVFPSDRIHNVALIAHGGAGKTSLADTALYDTGAVSRIGRVDDGSSVVDVDPDEQKRRTTLSLKIVPLEWRDTKINLLDTPGDTEFIGEVKSALRVADGAVLLVTAEKGVEVGTEMTWRYADERQVPRMVFVTKLDRENTSFDRALESLRERFGKRIAPLHAPIGAVAAFKGVVDICANKAYTFDNGKPTETAIPADMADQIAAYREQLVEAAVESDDDLMMKYLDGETISDDELCRAVKTAVAQGTLVPVLAGSIAKNIGVQSLLDAIVEYFPSAAATNAKEAASANINGSLAALVFKTVVDPQRGQITAFRVFNGALKPDSHTWNARTNTDERLGQLLLIRGKQQDVMTEVPAGDIACAVKLNNTHTGDTLTQKDHPVELPGIDFPQPAFTTAIVPKSKNDLDKLGNALARVVEEDPSIHVARDQETAETLLSGVGESHVDITIERMQRKFGVEVEKHDMHVPYREAIRKPARANGRFKRQSGGHGQFGDVTLEIAPLPAGDEQDFVFENKIVGGVVPKEYIPGVEKGVREALKKGFVAGYPMIHIRVAIVDGKYHPVDSSSQAFEVAASYAMQEAVPQANPVLLEPVMVATIVVPDTYMGDVTSNLTTKRGRVQGMETLGNGFTQVSAVVPMAEMLHYSRDLRSITQGRGTFSMVFDHYEEVPPNVQQQIVDAAKKAQASFAQSQH